MSGRAAPMIRGLAIALVLLVSGLGPGGAVLAQEGPSVEESFPPVEVIPAQTEPDLIGPPLPPAAETIINGVDYAAWARTASRTAAISETGTGSSFALTRLRADLVTWRDRFLDAQEVNGTRIATVDAQIAALGPLPAEGVTEDPRIVARRAALETERNRLRAPVLLAQEAYAEANGLITEVDRLLRGRLTDSLTTRGLTPLNPMHWPQVAGDVGVLAKGLWQEAKVTFGSAARRAILRDNLGQVLGLSLLGLVLLGRGQIWVSRVSRAVRARNPRGAGVWRLLLSLGQMALPLAGVAALTAALLASGLTGFRLSAVISQIPHAGALVIFAFWLSDRLFSADASVPLGADFDQPKRDRARRGAVMMGWLAGAAVMIEAVLASGEIAAVSRTAALLPVQILLGWVLFRFGRLFVSRQPAGEEGADESAPDPAAPTDAGTFRRGLLSVMGRAVMIIAVVGPLLTAAGYGVAGEALINPAVMTLALIGLVLVLQSLVFDLHALAMGNEDRSRDALLPVMAGVVLVLAALPVLALIWGARVEDLVEVWSRFRDGYSFGETRISPSDFVTFVIVFGIGFLLTRLLQGVLRTTILPKTRIDPGGRAALISGTGYIGIFLAALIAITSVGLDLSSLALVAGALSVGIGFGLQNIVQNFISGIILLIERPISDGDWIEVNGQHGTVRDISVRSTRIETFDRTNIIVPNADLISGQVTNWTRGSAVGRVIVPVSVMFGTDTDKVLEILREVAEGHPMVLLNPPPSVLLLSFGPDVLNFEIRAIVRDILFGLSVRSAMNVEIANRFHAEGIEFAGMARFNGQSGRTAASPPPAPGEMRVTLVKNEELGSSDGAVRPSRSDRIAGAINEEG